MANKLSFFYEETKLSLSWTKIFVFLIILFPAYAFSDDSFLGSWESPTGTKFHIINGFRSGLGPVLIQEPEEDFLTSNWVDEDGTIQIDYGWTGYNFSLLSESNALLSTDYSPDITLSRIEEPDKGTQFDIRQNQKFCRNSCFKRVDHC